MITGLNILCIKVLIYCINTFYYLILNEYFTATLKEQNNWKLILDWNFNTFKKKFDIHFISYCNTLYSFQINLKIRFLLFFHFYWGFYIKMQRQSIFLKHSGFFFTEIRKCTKADTISCNSLSKAPSDVAKIYQTNCAEVRKLTEFIYSYIFDVVTILLNTKNIYSFTKLYYK